MKLPNVAIKKMSKIQLLVSLTVIDEEEEEDDLKACFYKCKIFPNFPTFNLSITSRFLIYQSYPTLYIFPQKLMKSNRTSPFQFSCGNFYHIFPLRYLHNRNCNIKVFG